MDALVWSLRFGGVMQLALLVASVPALRILELSGNVAGCSRVVRQIVGFWHLWVSATVVAFAGMDLAFPEALAGAHPFGTFACAVLAVLWTGRLGVQLFVYDRDVRRAHRVGDLAFVAIFAYLAVVHVCAFLHGATGAGT
jgi:hypothetical protein